MKHCILAKYRPEVYPRRQELLPRIRQIFSAASELEGVIGLSQLRGAGQPVRCADRTGYGAGITAGVRRIGYAPPLEGGVRPAAGAEGHL